MMGRYVRKAYDDRPPRKRGDDAEAYAAWRATVPFSDAQFMAEFERMARVAEANGSTFLARRYRFHADKVRRGRLGAIEVKMVAAALTTACAICGKAALYRYGTSGRCREHKNAIPSFFADKHRRIDTDLASSAEENTARDRRLVGRSNASKCAKFGWRRRK